jgi:hypothetical protein
MLPVKYIYTLPILRIMSLDIEGAPTLKKSVTHAKHKRDLTCKERIKESLLSRGEDFERFMNAEDEETQEEFNFYGLCIDMVSMGTFSDMTEPYLRYQLSTGGPGDEINFYQNGKIEYRFLDWWDGATLDISTLDWAQWLREYFQDCGLLTNERFNNAWEE